MIFLCMSIIIIAVEHDTKIFTQFNYRSQKKPFDSVSRTAVF